MSGVLLMDLCVFTPICVCVCMFAYLCTGKALTHFFAVTPQQLMSCIQALLVTEACAKMHMYIACECVRE